MPVAITVTEQNVEASNQHNVKIATYQKSGGASRYHGLPPQSPGLAVRMPTSHIRVLGFGTPLRLLTSAS